MKLLGNVIAVCSLEKCLPKTLNGILLPDDAHEGIGPVRAEVKFIGSGVKDEDFVKLCSYDKRVFVYVHNHHGTELNVNDQKLRIYNFEDVLGYEE